MGRIIGIDLGTTNSLVAVIEGARPIIIPNNFGTNYMPSVVNISQEGKCVVGGAAYRQQILDPANTITSIKRFIGRKYNEIFDIALKVPYSVVTGPNNLACVAAHDMLYTPQVISALILRSLKESAEAYLQEVVTEAVITVPAYFNEVQTKATKEAGELAGLTVRRIIKEPTAAAMGYGLDKSGQDLKIAVFDLGGGTFDISILELGDGVFEVKSVDGDGFLGGDDFDQALEKWMIREIHLKHGVDLTADHEALSRIRQAAVHAKKELSIETETMVHIPFLKKRDGTLVDITISITRARFEEICEELFERLIPPCLNALRTAGLSVNEIDQVILVGGATRMPLITEIIRKVFQKAPTRSVNPDEAVALGAAIQAGTLEGRIRDILLLDVTPFSLGIETFDGQLCKMIASNTTIPTLKKETFSTFRHGQSSIEINILEGENKLAINNRSLGQLVIEGLSPLPAGVLKIEVTFDIDSNNILRVSAKETISGKAASIKIDVKTGLSDEQKLDTLPSYSNV